MDYCGPRGLAHSTFLDWSPSDRDKALWWLIHNRQTCPGCGTRAEEWEADRDAYVPEPHHCRGCEVKAGAEEWFGKHSKEFRRGSAMRLMPRAAVEARALNDDEAETDA